MNILCIETSGIDGTLALQCQQQILTARIATAQAQAEQLIPEIDALLHQAGIGLHELDAIGFGRGPGSFIGVRLATGVAQGLAAAAGIGIAPVSSMAALARQLTPQPIAPQRVAVCLDARMNEVYWGEFLCTADSVEATAPECLLSAQDVPWPSGRDWIAGGHGFSEYVELRDAARSRGFTLAPEARPVALDVLPLARAAVQSSRLVAPEHWHNSYLRDETAWKTRQ